MSNIVYIPLSRKLYEDIIRFSDGKVDPAAMAEFQLEAWVERDLEFNTTEEDFWGDRFEDAAAIYAPHLLKRLENERQQISDRRKESSKPLLWKEVQIPAGSEVRMTYGGQQYYAKIEGGRIVEDDGNRYTPSEWCSKVAGGTSRNAWRDLSFRELLGEWVPAQLYRDKAREKLGKKTLTLADLEESFDDK